MTTAQESAQRLAELIHDVRIAMLITQTAKGPVARPMATQTAVDNGRILFFTSKKSETARQVKRNDAVQVVYSNTDSNTYVHVQGTATLLRDRSMMAALWNPALLIWFPNGIDDPDLLLLAVDVKRAAYWKTPGMFSSALALARRTITGEASAETESGALEFSGTGARQVRKLPGKPGTNGKGRGGSSRKQAVRKATGRKAAKRIARRPAAATRKVAARGSAAAPRKRAAAARKRTAGRGRR